MKAALLSYVIGFAIVLCGITVTIMIDLSMNPWVASAASSFRWYNYFTADHGPTVAWMRYGIRGVLIYAAVFGAVLGLFSYRWVRRRTQAAFWQPERKKAE
jgi:hypothetical protein